MGKTKATVMVIGLGLVVAACAPTTLGSNWGTSYQAMKAHQILDPAAGEDLTPVTGQDGRVGSTALEAYRKGFEKPDAGLDRSLITSGVQTK